MIKVNVNLFDKLVGEYSPYKPGDIVRRRHYDGLYQILLIKSIKVFESGLQIEYLIGKLKKDGTLSKAIVLESDFFIEALE